MSNIVLVGFARCGKTTLAKMLAEQWACTYVDTDQHLIARHATQFKQELSIGQLYLQQGEQTFRQWEYECLYQLHAMNNVIIATGGGAVEAANSRKLVKQLGLVVYLHMNFTTALSRLQIQTWGPVVGSVNKLAKAQEIFSARDAYYNEIADLTIAVDDKEPMQLVQELIPLRESLCDH